MGSSGLEVVLETLRLEINLQMLQTGPSQSQHNIRIELLNINLIMELHSSDFTNKFCARAELFTQSELSSSASGLHSALTCNPDLCCVPGVCPGLHQEEGQGGADQSPG